MLITLTIYGILWKSIFKLSWKFQICHLRGRHGTGTVSWKIFSPRNRVPVFFSARDSPLKWVPESHVPRIWLPVPVRDPGFFNFQSWSTMVSVPNPEFFYASRSQSLVPDFSNFSLRSRKFWIWVPVPVPDFKMRIVLNFWFLEEIFFIRIDEKLIHL